MVIATGNRDKVREISVVLLDELDSFSVYSNEDTERKPVGIRIMSLADFPDAPKVIEDRDTIEANAMKKALEMAQYTGHICLADDTGLFIDALNGEPGVMAARFAGEDCCYQDNRLKTLKLMNGVTNRIANFRTVMALAEPNGIIAIHDGIVKGSITETERGLNGFGYDAVFEVEDLGVTFAEMEDDQKNRISHRAKALKAMIPLIKQLYDTV